MSISCRANSRLFAAVASALAIATLFFSLPAAAASSTDLQVIDVSPSATAQDTANAYAAFASGSAIIRMIGGTPEAFATMFNVPVANVTVSSQTGNNPTYLGVSGGTPSKLQAIAAYLDANGILRSVLAFAPDSSNSSANNAVADNGAASTWQSHLDDWIVEAQSNASQGLAGSALGDPTPPEQAWTLLYTTTVQNYSNHGYEQSTQGFYRLNTISPEHDYYMVTSVPETKPDYNGNCDGVSHCDWHTVERDFEIDGPAGATLVDHGPTGTIGSGSQSWTIGGSVGPEGPGINAAFSASWEQQDVSTVDQSTSQSAKWQEAFHFYGLRCDPVVDTISAVSTGTFLSRQGAIFQVPGGTSNVSFPVTTQSLFCNTNGYLGASYDWNTITTNFPLGPPVLSAYPRNMTIPAGGSAPLLVSALIPFSTQGVVWNITSNQLWLTTPSSGPFSTGQAIPVSVAPDAPKGATATLSINTSPPFAAPSVETGPILVDVTVGAPQASTPAGILLFGGLTSPNTPAEFYSLAAKQSFPVKANVPYRLYHTATLLRTGKILIVGGATAPLPNGSPAPVTATAELFDPATFTFSNTGSLATARYAHTATLLRDGKVLIFGGIDASGKPLGSAELYDPATGTFSNAGTLPTPRAFLTASLMAPAGSASQVLLYGGTTTGQFAPDNGFEVWDEAKKGATSEGNIAAATYLIPQPVANSDGWLDLVGGYDANKNVTAQEQLLNLNEPNTISFQPGQPLNVPRVRHTLTALPGGDLLVTGGEGTDGTALASAEIRDSQGWHLLSGTASCPGNPGCMLYPRDGHTATLLPDGTVLIAGGGNAQSEFYSPAQKTFSPGPQLLARGRHTATLVVGTATNLLVSPSSPTAGQNVQLSATVTSAAGTPSGSVQFLDGSKVLGTATLSSGQASIELSPLPVGSHSLSAVYTGDGVSSPSTSPVATVEIAKAQTTTALSSSANPSPFGQLVTFSATVTSSSGTLSGQVYFNDGSHTIGSGRLINGAAQFTAQGLAMGPHTMTASYSGDDVHAASTSTAVIQTVGQGNSTTTVDTAVRTRFGQPLQLRARVQVHDSPTAPTGSVTFKDGQTSLGSASLNNGAATLQVSTLGAGFHSITATYSGDNLFTGSVSQPVTVSVEQEGSDVALASSANPSEAQQAVTFSATITAKDQSVSGTPTGTVIFSDGGNQLGTAQLTGGKASFTTSTLAPGKHSISAVYSGDTNFLSSTSRALEQTVNDGATNTTVDPVPPTRFGLPVQLRATVKAGTSQTPPTGSVTFKDGQTSLGSASLNNGAATLQISSLGAGSHPITATYSGDSTHLGSVSQPVTVTIEQEGTDAAIASSANPSEAQQAVTFSATVTARDQNISGVPTGTVVFSDGGNQLGTAQLTSGKASFTTSTLAPGKHSITAAYSGDANFLSSTSRAVEQTVKAQKQTTTTTLTSNPNPSAMNQSVTFTAAVTSPSGTPTGTVTFKDNGTPIGSGTLVNGAASLTTSTLSTGPHQITAAYGGDANFLESTSGPLTQTVNSLAPVTATIKSSPNPSTLGQTVTFTVLISSQAGGTPTGSITISEGSTIYGSAQLINGVGVVSESDPNILTVGSHEIRVTYGGDSTHQSLTSPPFLQTVNPAATTLGGPPPSAALQNQ